MSDVLFAAGGKSVVAYDTTFSGGQFYLPTLCAHSNPCRSHCCGVSTDDAADAYTVLYIKALLEHNWADARTTRSREKNTNAVRTARNALSETSLIAQFCSNLNTVLHSTVL